MRYLVDTDISSYFLRGKHNLHNIFKEKGFSEIRISRVTYAELMVLANRNPESRVNQGAITSFSEMLGVLEIDERVWDLFSELKAKVLSEGKPCGDFDILNSAVAKRHNLVVVTNNTSHYKDVADRVENWIVHAK